MIRKYINETSVRVKIFDENTNNCQEKCFLFYEKFYSDTDILKAVQRRLEGKDLLAVKIIEKDFSKKLFEITEEAFIKNANFIGKVEGIT